MTTPIVIEFPDALGQAFATAPEGTKRYCTAVLLTALGHLLTPPADEINVARVAAYPSVHRVLVEQAHDLHDRLAWMEHRAQEARTACEQEAWSDAMQIVEAVWDEPYPRTELDAFVAKLSSWCGLSPSFGAAEFDLLLRGIREMVTDAGGTLQRTIRRGRAGKWKSVGGKVSFEWGVDEIFYGPLLDSPLHGDYGGDPSMISAWSATLDLAEMRRGPRAGGRHLILPAS